ncbi:uncharacterized protein [Mytilus edulis]|uniref:uncharacterized protein isoform X2 n=1 Tax=Mytilus edulis TaxID=6550 RepID=UPI0039EEDFF6
MEQRHSVMQALWLIMCVFLFYQQSIDMVSGLQNIKKKNVNFSDPFNSKCSEFEVFDGFECVCTNDASYRCQHIGGLVCDNTGAVYSTPCMFAVNMCQQTIPLDRQISSCGACRKLKLTGGMKYPEGQIHATFVRQGQDMELKTKYKSTKGDDLQVFYSSELSAWTVGKITLNKTYVSLVQEMNSTYPQDNEGGMLVVKMKDNNVTWEADSSLHLECMEDDEIDRTRKKRFFFLIALIVASVVVSAAVTTLKVVQAKKGCLYYPSVCKMRDNIKKKLKPEVTKLRDSFLSKYGDPEKISALVDKIHDNVLDTKDKITTVKQLHTKLKGLLSSVIQDHGSFIEDIPDMKSLLEEHKQWLDSKWKSTYIDIAMIAVETVIAAVTIAATTTASVFATAAAGIGLVFAIGFGIVDVVTSVIEERKIRDKLRKAQATLIQAKKDINIAFQNMKKFQKQFCKVVISFLRDISFNGKDYDYTFFNLYNFISKTYGKSTNGCRWVSVYSKSNFNTLKMLNGQYIQPLLNFLSIDIASLKKRIVEVEETQAFLRELNSRILTKKLSPRKLFGFLKRHKPKMAKKMFVTLFDLLKYIASVLPKVKCYWGTHLDSIRNNKVTIKNYLQSPICDCPEIDKFTQKLKTGVKQNIAPCKLTTQVQSSVFNCNYRVIKFIADVILLNESCYWGYDLRSLRNQHTPLEINNGVVDSHLFLSLKFFKSSKLDTNLILMARTLLCTKHKVCSHGWQNFLLCLVLNIPDSNTVCSKSNILTPGPQCIPDDKRFQSCDI